MVLQRLEYALNLVLGKFLTLPEWNLPQIVWKYPKVSFNTQTDEIQPQFA